MVQLELGGRRWPLAPGETVIGSSPAAAVHLDEAGVLDRHAVVRATTEGAAVRPAGPDAVVSVNGVRLTGDPIPLLHGDKVQVGPVELVVVDDRRAGQTQMVDAAALRAATAASTPPGARPAGEGTGASAGATAGRFVSQADGREYQIGKEPLVFGRDAGCDVVLESTDVSRRHAAVSLSPEGYVLEDMSTNGVVVNGERVQGRRLLRRGDLLGLGGITFRFYAEPAPLPPRPSPPAGAAHKLYETAHGIPAMVPAFPSRPTAPPPLATVLVRSGSLRGQRLPIRTPVVNIGRAEYNDLVFGDESVSAAHAKLQRREEVWVLADLDSTNGTYVDGDQVRGEVPLMAGSTVRFGDVTVLFDPTDLRGPAPPGGGTRVVGAISIPDTPRMEVRPSITPDAPRPERRRVARRPASARRSKVGRWVVAALVLLAAAALYYLIGR